MYSQILNILYDYSTKRKFVDEYYIRTIIDIVTKYKKTKEFVLGVNIVQNNHGNTEVAEYSPFNKDITVFMDNVSSTLLQPNMYDRLFDSSINQSYLFHNLLVTQKILKQLEFAYHKKLLRINSNTIETRILRPCYSDTLDYELGKNEMSAVEHYRRYRKYLAESKKDDIYLLSPSERISSITSYGDICRILDGIKHSYNQLSDFYFASLEEAKFYGYEIGLSPIEKYYSKSNSQSESLWKSLGVYDDDRLKLLRSFAKRNEFPKRIVLGLPITIDEYLYTDKIIKSSEKYAYEKRLK